ncbi:MAG: hypothetical protein SW019_17630 [Actinomycetota bacterium]|nr:hypothetical protein [Actinomycetota bacterium]
MILRRSALAVGLVAVLVGIVGLLVPVSVSPGLSTVSCGSAVSPEPATAQEQAPADTRTQPEAPPFYSEQVDNVDYAELCSDEISDRRAWTITVIVVGVLTLIAAAALAVRARRADTADT